MTLNGIAAFNVVASFREAKLLSSTTIMQIVDRETLLRLVERGGYVRQFEITATPPVSHVGAALL